MSRQDAENAESRYIAAYQHRVDQGIKEAVGAVGPLLGSRKISIRRNNPGERYKMEVGGREEYEDNRGDRMGERAGARGKEQWD